MRKLPPVVVGCLCTAVILFSSARAEAVSAGKPYVLSPAPSSSYPDSGSELTDGVTATGESWANAAGWLYVNPTITLDLGQSYQLTEVQLYVGNSHGNGSYGVARPASVTVSVSSDGVNFTAAGNLAFSAWSDIGTKNQVDRGRATVNAIGRWVRFAIIAGGPWVMATECVITGNISGTNPGTNVSLGKSYSLSPAPASNYPDSGGELTNGVTATGSSWANAAGWLNVNPTIILDLGQAYSLTEVQLFAGNSHGNGSYGVAQPANVTVSVSSDGVSFTTLGSLTFSAFSDVGTKNQVDRGNLAVSTTARWIRYSVQAGGSWVMVTELAAWGGS